MADDETPLGDLILQGLLPDRPPVWDPEQVTAATEAALAIGLDPTATIRLFDQAAVASVLVTAPIIRRTYAISRRTLDRILTTCGYTITQRRAALGLPPV